MKKTGFSKILKELKFIFKKVLFNLIIPVFLFWVYSNNFSYYIERLERDKKDVYLLNSIYTISWLLIGSYIIVNFVCSFSKKNKSSFVSKLIVSIFVVLVIILLVLIQVKLTTPQSL
jgi:hypothetical protein